MPLNWLNPLSLTCCVVVLLKCNRYSECSLPFIDEIDIKQEPIEIVKKVLKSSVVPIFSN